MPCEAQKQPRLIVYDRPGLKWWAVQGSNL